MIKKIIPKNMKAAFNKAMRKRLGISEYNEMVNALNNEFYINIVKERQQIETSIPKVDLGYQHIANLKMLLNRNNLLQQLPRESICAEIGVNEGEFSKEILSITLPEKLHLIDAWGNPSRYHDGLQLVVHDKFSTEIEKGQVEINVGFSTVILKKMPDFYFDWVYVDTDHSYGVTRDELAILKTKVKPGGIIAGHDYVIGNWVNNCRYGVIEAVHELCVTDHWELLFLTVNQNEMPSFAIRKLV
jgi:hypothetical protein